MTMEIWAALAKPSDRNPGYVCPIQPEIAVQLEALRESRLALEAVDKEGFLRLESDGYYDGPVPTPENPPDSCPSSGLICEENIDPTTGNGELILTTAEGVEIPLRQVVENLKAMGYSDISEEDVSLSSNYCLDSNRGMSCATFRRTYVPVEGWRVLDGRVAEVDFRMAIEKTFEDTQNTFIDGSEPAQVAAPAISIPVQSPAPSIPEKAEEGGGQKETKPKPPWLAYVGSGVVAILGYLLFKGERDGVKDAEACRLTEERREQSEAMAERNEEVKKEAELEKLREEIREKNREEMEKKLGGGLFHQLPRATLEILARQADEEKRATQRLGEITMDMNDRGI